jgi:hypothetical protein
MAVERQFQIYQIHSVYELCEKLHHAFHMGCEQQIRQHLRRVLYRAYVPLCVLAEQNVTTMHTMQSVPPSLSLH